MRSLVTGGAGFLGSGIASRLAASGWEVVRAGRPELEIPSPAFDELLAATAPQLIVHCAGPASVPDSMADPAADFARSAGVLDGVLDRARELSEPPRFIFLSSAAVYGDPESLPISESQELRPVSPYGYHRAACETLLAEYNAIYSLPTAALRIFSAYGEGLRRQILWDATRKGLDDGKIALMGTGRESRDFVHADDVAAAVLAILDGAEFAAEAYNVASGRETTIAELAGLIAQALGLPADSVAFDGSSRPGDPINWRADISRLSALGFSPAVEIEEGVPAYVDWVRNL